MVTGTGDERVAVAAMKMGVSDYLIKDADGSFVNVLPLVIDRAIEQRRLLAEKQQMEEELARAQRMKSIGQLAAGIAHEINTPTQYIAANARFLQDAFANIGGLLDAFERLLKAERDNTVTDGLLREMESQLRGADLGYLSEQIPQAIQQSLEGVDHVAEIVSAMRDFSHPGGGLKQPTDLSRTIDGAITLCRNEWKYVADVVTDFDSDLPMVCCQSADIHRVVLNLLVNAAHAIAGAAVPGRAAKGTITVRTRQLGPWAEIRVEDTGIGIPEQNRAHVFDLFFTTKEVGQGTGQGLSITQAIVVKQHGGTIHFESEVGRGTIFVVRLPIEPVSETNGQPAAETFEAVRQPTAP